MQNTITKLPAKYTQGFLKQLDARMGLAKELYRAYDEITEDLGGAEGLSHVKRVLVEKFVWLTAIMRGVEKQIAGSDEEQSAELLGRWVQGLNSLTGLAKTIGLERRARKVDLKSYVEGVHK